MNIRLECSTHGASTLNCPTPMSSPWNEDPKLSDSHVQPMEQRLQTVWLPCPTHGTKASNCLTLTSNPWNKGLKPSNSHVQPMERRPKPSNSHIQPMAQRPQTGIQYPWNKGFKPSDSHIQPMELPTSPNDDRHDDAKHDLLAVKVLTSSGVSAMKSDGKWINNAHYLSCI